MTRDSILNYVYENFGTKPDYPWEKDPKSAVLRHKRSGKWYGLIMEIPGEKVGLTEKELVDVLNIKGEPEMISQLAVQKGFAPAYHMNKTHWLTVILDGSVPETEVYNLIDISYEMTKK